MNEKGFTLQEIMLTMAVVGILGLAVSKAVGYLMLSQMKSQAQADLQNDAIQIIQKMTVAMQTAGSGVPNCSIVGKSIFATASGVDISSITFFYQDSGCRSAQMDTQDQWLQYSLNNGQIYQTLFQTNYSGNALPFTNIISQSPLRLSSDAVVTNLQFNFYNSNDPPQRVLDGHAASRVRVHLEISKKGTVMSRDALIPLGNVLNAIQTSNCPTPC